MLTRMAELAMRRNDHNVAHIRPPAVSATLTVSHALNVAHNRAADNRATLRRPR
jgi:hypothetical protein